jgi:hypothetical protein
VKQFWDILQLPVHLILQTLGESSVPKTVLNLVENVIQFKKVCGFFVNNSSSAPQVHSKSNALKLAKSNQHSKEYEFPSDHISDGNTCLLSSCCCYLEGDDN